MRFRSSVSVIIAGGVWGSFVPTLLLLLLLLLRSFIICKLLSATEIWPSPGRLAPKRQPLWTIEEEINRAGSPTEEKKVVGTVGSCSSLFSSPYSSCVHNVHTHYVHTFAMYSYFRPRTM